MHGTYNPDAGATQINIAINSALDHPRTDNNLPSRLRQATWPCTVDIDSRPQESAAIVVIRYDNGGRVVRKQRRLLHAWEAPQARRIGIFVDEVATFASGTRAFTLGIQGQRRVQTGQVHRRSMGTLAAKERPKQDQAVPAQAVVKGAWIDDGLIDSSSEPINF